MAGAGVKLFIDGEILDAAEVNTYLQDQVIMRFANAATRDAAFGGVGEPVLAEGMFCYLNDTNTLQSYNGSAWVNVVSSTYPPGLQHVATVTATGTSTIILVDNVFSNDFQNYKVMVSLAPAGVNFNAVFGNFLDLSGNQIASSYYSSIYSQDYASGTSGFGTMRSSTTAFYIGWIPVSGGYLGASFDNSNKCDGNLYRYQQWFRICWRTDNGDAYSHHAVPWFSCSCRYRLTKSDRNNPCVWVS
jgi:hypothetical protein